MGSQGLPLRRLQHPHLSWGLTCSAGRAGVQWGSGVRELCSLGACTSVWLHAVLLILRLYLDSVDTACGCELLIALGSARGCLGCKSKPITRVERAP